MLSSLTSIPSLESFLPPQCPPWRGSVAKGDGKGWAVGSVWKPAKVDRINSGFPAYGIPKGWGGCCSQMRGSRCGGGGVLGSGMEL